MWYNGTQQYYLYTDATGAEYVLDQNNGSNVWSSLQGIYVWYDANLDILHFRDGSFWNMTVQSASVEQDAGTLYPSQIEDPNGNFISLVYMPGAGCNYGCVWNQSSRIFTIDDARGIGTQQIFATYYLAWSGSGIPHLTALVNYIGTNEYYGFTTASQSLVDPFLSQSYGTGTGTVLQSMSTVAGSYQFLYNSSAEMTKMTNPLGGWLKWLYITQHYSARTYRGVWQRSVNSGGNSGYDDMVYIGLGNNQNWTSQAVVTNNNSLAQTLWNFSTASDYTAGLLTGYNETDLNGNHKRKFYSWAQSSSGNPYVSSVTTNLDSTSINTTTQQVDAYGNLTQQQITDFSGSPTGTRTYNMTYTASQYWYAPLYILNRLVTATVNGVTLISIGYDGCPYGATSATSYHDSRYNTGFYFRGNPSSVSALGGTTTACYDTAGVPVQVGNTSGQSVGLQTDSTTNYSLPTVIQPNGNSSMQSTATYLSSWAPASLTGPNGNTGTTTYDSSGRPAQTTTPDGAVTTYTYSYSPGANTQTATLDGRWQSTTIDGFGRTIQVQKGNGSTVVSTVQTQYAPAGTVPLGMIASVSQPFSPGANPVWTTYT